MENRWEERKKHLDKTKRGDVIKGGWKNSTGREVLSNSMGKQVERTTEMKCTQQIPNYRAQNTTNTVTLKSQGGKQDLTETLRVGGMERIHGTNDSRVCYAPNTCWEEEEQPHRLR